MMRLPPRKRHSHSLSQNLWLETIFKQDAGLREVHQCTDDVVALVERAAQLSEAQVGKVSPDRLEDRRWRRQQRRQRKLYSRGGGNGDV